MSIVEFWAPRCRVVFCGVSERQRGGDSLFVAEFRMRNSAGAHGCKR